MKFHCRVCQEPQTERLFFASYLEREGQARFGFLCAPCHDDLEEAGRIIGYVPSQGSGAEWIAKLFALRTLNDQFPNPTFQYARIRRMQREIPLPPVRTVCDLIDRIADAYCWLATDHGGLRTFEGWLFGTAGRQLKLMLDGENEKVRQKAHRTRYRSILSLHDAVVAAAGRKDRQEVLRSLVGLVAATYSSQFKPSTLESGAKRAHAQDFLISLGARAPLSLGAYESWEAINTGDPWVVFVASRVGMVRRATLRRVCDLLLQALTTGESHRYEVALRTLHWDVLVARCLQMTSLSGPA